MLNKSIIKIIAQHKYSELYLEKDQILFISLK